MRGYGRSKDLEGAYTLEEVTQDCLALADHLGWEHFHVVGHSMTGLAVQHLNATALERMVSVTPITPVPATGSPIPEDFLEVIRQGVRGDDAIMSDIIGGTTGGRYSGANICYKLKQFRETATVDARLGYLKMFTENDISTQVQGLETPYHVIIGRCDSKWHNCEVIENSFGVYFPNCIMTEIADAGHCPMYDTPPLFWQDISKTLF